MDSQLRHVRQIRILYRLADEEIRKQGLRWYEREHKEARALANDSGLPLDRLCACLAILSPRCQWPRVKYSLRELLAGKTPKGLFDRNLEKVRQIIRGYDGICIDPKTAPKTWAFWQNLWHPKDPKPVTLDSWMLTAHGLPASIGPARYKKLADCYRLVAWELLLIPNQLQATVWLAVRQKSHKGKERRENMLPAEREPDKACPQDCLR